MLWFRSDGRGRWDFSNFALCTVEFFEWEPAAPDTVRIRGTRTLQWAGDAVEEEPPWLQGWRDCKFTIGEEDCPNGHRLEVLRIGLGVGFEEAYARWPHEPDDFDNPDLGL